MDKTTMATEDLGERIARYLPIANIFTEKGSQYGTIKDVREGMPTDTSPRLETDASGTRGDVRKEGAANGRQLGDGQDRGPVGDRVHVAVVREDGADTVGELTKAYREAVAIVGTTKSDDIRRLAQAVVDGMFDLIQEAKLIHPSTTEANKS